MKCTQCGCKELTNIPVPFSAEDFRANRGLNVYICNECGHLEFFNSYWSGRLMELELQLKSLERKQEEIPQEIEKREKAKLELESKIQKLKKQLKNAENELKKVMSEKDITVRQQEEASAQLKAKIKAINDEIEKTSSDSSANTDSLHLELWKIEHQIREIKEQLKELPYLR